jgi:hypothetical protein
MNFSGYVLTKYRIEMISFYRSGGFHDRRRAGARAVPKHAEGAEKCLG